MIKTCLNLERGKRLPEQNGFIEWERRRERGLWACLINRNVRPLDKWANLTLNFPGTGIKKSKGKVKKSY